ncbi:MAG: hypothetical protein R6V36_10765 [Psychroflexus sp.]
MITRVDKFGTRSLSRTTLRGVPPSAHLSDFWGDTQAANEDRL